MVIIVMPNPGPSPTRENPYPFSGRKQKLANHYDVYDYYEPVRGSAATVSLKAR